MLDPIRRILDAFPAAFFRQIDEVVDASFAEAFTLAQRHVAEPERANILGQLRHARCEAGIRKAAQDVGINVYAPHTDPAGGRYSLVESHGVYLLRSNIQRHCGPPRATAFRQQWASVNRWLSPSQLDLLRETAPPVRDRLCAMLVVSSHPRRGDPSIPGYVGVGIPNDQLTDWLRLIPITDLLAMYHDADAVARTPSEAPVKPIDKAMPRLKRRPEAG
jgi:hypothetical protein